MLHRRGVTVWREQECVSLCAIGDISVLAGQLDEYGSVRRTCQGCDIGRYATSSQSDTGALYFCNDCETGRYMNLTGVSACLYCPTGTIADDTASTTCRACAPGSSTATLGTVICNNCSVGKLSKSIRADELRFLQRWIPRPFDWTDCVSFCRLFCRWYCGCPGCAAANMWDLCLGFRPIAGAGEA